MSFKIVRDAVDRYYDNLMAATTFQVAEERYAALTAFIDSLALPDDRMTASDRVLERLRQDEEVDDDE